jgi:hypothetical protein
MNRRTFLCTCSTVGGITTSGCLDDTRDESLSSQKNASSPREDETTQPEAVPTEVEQKDKEATLELLDTGVDANSVVYNDEFTVTAVFGNVGNEPMRETSIISAPTLRVSFSGTDRSFQGSEQQAAPRIEIPPGKTTAVRLGPFEAAATGEWRIESGEYIEYTRDGAETAFKVQTRSVPVGRPITVYPNVSITVEKFHLLEAFFNDYTSTDGEPVVGLETAPSDQRFVVAEMTLANETPNAVYVDDIPQEPYQLASSQLSLESTASYGLSSGGMPENARLPGEPFRDIILEAGESISTRLLGVIDIARRDSIAVEFAKFENTGPPEAVVEIVDTGYPEFELVEFAPPAQWEEGQQEANVRVRNIGDAPGPFRGVVQYAANEDAPFADPRSGIVSPDPVPPGETVEITTTLDRGQGTRYRLLPFGETVESPDS